MNWSKQNKGKTALHSLIVQHEHINRQHIALLFNNRSHQRRSIYKLIPTTKTLNSRFNFIAHPKGGLSFESLSRILNPYLSSSDRMRRFIQLQGYHFNFTFWIWGQQQVVLEKPKFPIRSILNQVKKDSQNLAKTDWTHFVKTGWTQLKK